MKISFIWDKNKELTNARKHGITFEEAKTAFEDENARIFYDETHSTHEDRYILLGYSNQAKLLIVCHCEQINNQIRIYSARKATKNESKYYKGE